MKDTEDKILIDDAPTTGSILKHLLSLSKLKKRRWVLIDMHFGDSNFEVVVDEIEVGF